MCYIGGKVSLTDGWNTKDFHPPLIKDYTEIIPLMVKTGYKDVICFSGSRRGMDDETGWKNCVEGLQKVLPLAEKNGITIHMWNCLPVSVVTKMELKLYPTVNFYLRGK